MVLCFTFCLKIQQIQANQPRTVTSFWNHSCREKCKGKSSSLFEPAPDQKIMMQQWAKRFSSFLPPLLRAPRSSGNAGTLHLSRPSVYVCVLGLFPLWSREKRLTSDCWTRALFSSIGGHVRPPLAVSAAVSRAMVEERLGSPWQHLVGPESTGGGSLLCMQYSILILYLESTTCFFGISVWLHGGKNLITWCFDFLIQL